MTKCATTKWACAAILGAALALVNAGTATDALAAPTKAAVKKPEKKAPTKDGAKPKRSGKKKPGGGPAVRPPAPLPEITRGPRNTTRIAGGPTIVATAAAGGIFLHVDFGVSPRLDPEARPGLAELAARAWFVESGALWRRVEGRGGRAALVVRGNRLGLTIGLPGGEGAFASWLLPRIFDQGAPRAEVVATAATQLADARDPVHDTLVEQLHQGSKALAHRPDPEKLRGTTGAEIQAFLRSAFAPERATIGVVAAEGEVVCDAGCAEAFAALAGRAGTHGPTPPAPEQTLQRTVEIDPSGPTAAATYGFLVAADPRRQAALRIAGEVACHANEGRLAARLALTGARCDAALELRDGLGLFTVRVASTDEAMLGKAIARLDEELLALQKTPLTVAELAAARDRALVRLLEEAADPVEIAAQLAERRAGPADFAEAARDLDPASLADELSKGLDPLRRAVVVQRRGKDRLWKTPYPPGTGPKKGKEKDEPRPKEEPKKEPRPKATKKEPRPAGAPAKRKP